MPVQCRAGLSTSDPEGQYPKYVMPARFDICTTAEGSIVEYTSWDLQWRRRAEPLVQQGGSHGCSDLQLPSDCIQPAVAGPCSLRSLPCYTDSSDLFQGACLSSQGQTRQPGALHPELWLVARAACSMQGRQRSWAPMGPGGVCGLSRAVQSATVCRWKLTYQPELPRAGRAAVPWRALGATNAINLAGPM